VLGVLLLAHESGQSVILGVVAEGTGIKKVTQQVFSCEGADEAGVVGFQGGFGLRDVGLQVGEDLGRDAATHDRDAQVRSGRDFVFIGKGAVASVGNAEVETEVFAQRHGVALFDDLAIYR